MLAGAVPPRPAKGAGPRWGNDCDFGTAHQFSTRRAINAAKPMSVRRRAHGWGLAFSLLALSASALAEPFTEQSPQAAAGVAYGLYVGEAAGEIPSPYGLGLAARAGYTLGGAYLGAELNYFLGASQRFAEYGDVEGSLSIIHYGAEAGYDVAPIRRLVIRPKLGLGLARVTATLRVEGVTGDVVETGLAVVGGVQVLYAWEPWFASFDARYTSLSIETKALGELPGVAVNDATKLDGLLFSLCAGFAF